jgi:hypothetical protein
MTAIPPALAIAIAIELSETVSIAAATTGVFSTIFLENEDAIETSLGRTSEYAGTSNTSSYVKPSPIIFEFGLDMALNFRVNSGKCTKK